jgi:hypothetical protein
MISDRTTDIALASAAATRSLIETLIRKNVLSRDEGSQVLDTAEKRLEAYSLTAAAIIREAKILIFRNL